jgi:8-oxo-dGTP pyrophosphatase MutT (NUDIX family)
MRDRVIGAFNGSGVAPDPAAPRNLWPPPPDAEFAGRKLRGAAVLVPLVDHPAGMTVILTQRTQSLPSHAGQIALPGGRRADDEATPEATALRESAEEIGLAPSRVRLLGRLNAHDTHTGYRVLPVVGLVDSPVDLVPDPSEVAAVFELPVAHMLDPANHRLETRLQRGVERQFRIIAYKDYFIWGLTARVLGELVERLQR